MAYKRRSSKGRVSRSYGSARRTGRRGYSGSRGVSRRRGRSATRGQTVRIVIEQPTVTSAQRPEVGVMERTKKERRF